MPVPDYVSGKAFGHDETPVVSEINLIETGHQRAIYAGDYKYIKIEKERESELYNFKTDPNETINLVGELPEVTASMKEELEKWDQEHKPKLNKIKDSSKMEHSPEMLDGLKALGYIQ